MLLRVLVDEAAHTECDSRFSVHDENGSGYIVCGRREAWLSVFRTHLVCWATSRLRGLFRVWSTWGWPKTGDATTLPPSGGARSPGVSFRAPQSEALRFAVSANSPGSPVQIGAAPAACSSKPSAPWLGPELPLLYSDRFTADSIIAVKASAFRLAPPTRAPSMSGCSSNRSTLSGLTLPP